jgi:ClpP class serine protease
MKKEGIGVTLITAGEHKVDGHPFGPLPEDVETEWKADLKWLQGLFAESVARNRNMTVEAVLATEARVYRGQDAVDIGLADHVRLEHEVFDEFAAQLARAEGAASRQTA